MSMNLALKKGKKVEHQILYQTPTYITNAALDSVNTLEYYKNWVLEERKGKFYEETLEHFAVVEELIEDGWKFIMV